VNNSNKDQNKIAKSRVGSQKKIQVPRNGSPRVPRERYDRVERRIIRLEQGLGIRELDLKNKKTADWMTEDELIDLERRVKRIQKKLEFSDDEWAAI
jgi:hypothetical protein